MVITILLLTIQSVNGTMELSNRFLAVIVRSCERLGIETTDAWWNSSVNIRRIGHTIEYFVLAVSAGFAFKRVWQDLIFCTVVSILDQFTKAFVPIRHLDINDLPFDMVGIVAGVLVFTVIKVTVKMLKSMSSN